MKISLLTPTGDRPEAMALCQKWMARQTMQWHEWIVIDDGREATPVTIPESVIFKIQPEKGNTQNKNLEMGMRFITGDVVFFIEDDDYYRPNYIERMMAHLALPDIAAVGETHATYYNVAKRKWRRLGNRRVACLCQTAIKRKYFSYFNSLVKKTKPPRAVDGPFWLGLEKDPAAILLPKTECVVGIKGMPGRGGAGAGHKAEGMWQRDPDLSFLKEMVGDDFPDYEPFCKL